MRCAITLLAMSVLFSGCATTNPGQRVTLPQKEYVMGSNQSVSVRLMEGGWNPWCDLPDAADEISCIFYYGWLESMPMQGSEGYRFLAYDTAFRACADATWTLGGQRTWGVVSACARALLTYRWMQDGEYGTEGESR